MSLSIFNRYSISLTQAAPVVLSLSSLTLISFALSEASLSTLMLYVLFGTLGVGLIWRVGYTALRLFVTVYGFASILNVLFYVILIGQYGVPYYQGGSDDLVYEHYGQIFADRYAYAQILDYPSVQETVIGTRHNSVGYVYLIGLLTKLGNSMGSFNTMIPRLFNSFLLGLISVLTFRYVLSATKHVVLSITSGLFAGLMPVMVFIGSFTFRDHTISFLLLLLFVIWAPSTFNTKSLFTKIIFTLPCIIILSEFRIQSALLATTAVLATYGLTCSRNKLPTAFVIVVLSMAVTIYLALQWEFISLIISLDLIDKYIQSYSELRAGYGSLTSIVFEVQFPLAIPIRIIYGLFSPLPGVSISFTNMLFIFSVLIIIFYFPFLITGIVFIIKRREYWPILIFIGITFLPYALITGASRHITYHWPFLVIIAAFGFTSSTSLRKIRHSTYAMSISVSGIIVALLLSIRLS